MARAVRKGKTLAEAEIGPTWLPFYGLIARRCRDEKDFGITLYPFEQGPGFEVRTGGLKPPKMFFEHQEWPLRRGMEKNSSLEAVSEYEANYILTHLAIGWHFMKQP